MTALPVSVIVVSRNRPAALIRCLTGLSQQFHPSFEVVVVCDPGSFGAINQSAFAGLVKLVEFDEPNISKARNIGVSQSAGEIVAFIDDDAVPEPSWLTHLSDVFDADPKVVAAGGFVRARNGISYQWKASSVDSVAQTQGLPVDDLRPTVLHPTDGRAIKTEGTNMAFRREPLAEMGGFDPAFQYFLDETDVNLRLASAGRATAIVPLAEVHHGFHANATRRGDRVPSDLFQIGASYVVFLRKHCAAELQDAAVADFVKQQRIRLLRHMTSGALLPGQVRRLMGRLAQGMAEGRKRPIGALPALPRASEGLRTFPSRAGAMSVVVAGRHWNARRLRREAVEKVRQGYVVTLFLFSRTALYHHVSFNGDGYWVQTGGLFGRSDRDQPLFRITPFGKRVVSEKLRVAEQRRLFDGQKHHQEEVR